MTLDRSDATVVHLQPANGDARKLVVEPRSDGRYELVDKRWTGDRWRVAGTELVEHVAVSTPGDTLVPGAQSSD